MLSNCGQRLSAHIIYVEYQAESELHYFKYTLRGDEVTKGTLLIYCDNYIKSAAVPIVHIGGNIYLLKNSTHMLVINGTTSKMHYEPLQKTNSQDKN